MLARLDEQNCDQRSNHIANLHQPTGDARVVWFPARTV
jgi:hypothetical protein